MADEYDDPDFDRLAASALDQAQQSFPKQPVPQKQIRPGFNAILVNSTQNGNAILASIKSVPWEYADIQPDFVIGATACAIFLSLRYHRLHPEYIYNRIKDLGKQFVLRIMLVLCDIDNHKESLRELTKTCVVSDFTLIVAWSPAEAGRYLESFKSLESAPAKEIKGHVSTVYSDQLVDCLTSIRSVNKTDAYNLIGTFGSLKNAFNASAEELSAIAGWGPQKVKNYMNAINAPFSIKTGTSKRRQEEILMQATQVVRDDYNGDFGPGKDHSSARGSSAQIRAPVDETRTDSMPQGDFSQVAEALVGKPINVQETMIEEETSTGDRSRKSNPEYQGTLDILKKMREASGYGLGSE